MTEIWYLCLCDVPHEATLRKALPSSLLLGSEKYKDEKARWRSVAVRALLWYALQKKGEVGVSLAFSSLGRPRLDGSNLDVSLSHSEHYVAVALGDAPLGVDIEETGAVKHPSALAKRYLPPHEAEAVLEAECQALAFLLSFTRLEAQTKQKDGRTISDAMKLPAPPPDKLFQRTWHSQAHETVVLTAVGEGQFLEHEVNDLKLF